MPLIRTLGILLIVIGLAVLIVGGISYTTKDTVLKAGPVEVTREDREYVALPPLLGGAALLVGAAIVLGTSRRR